MSTGRAVAILVLAALACAAAVGLAARAPAALRQARPAPEATDPGLGARFSDTDVARHGAYRAPGYLAFALGLALSVAALVVLARGPFGRAVALTERLPGGWALRAAVLGAGLSVVLTLVALPLAFVRGYVIEHAWGLSTQDLWDWLADRGRALGVEAVVAALAAVAFFGALRLAPRAWWLLGAAAFSALSALFVYLWPVVIAPLFNRFEPLADPSLVARVKQLAAKAGVEIDEVLVADASRRTTAENAYVAGLGATRQVVLYDTLLVNPDERSVAFVVAHELGHEVKRHVLKNVALTTAGLLASFALLGWLANRAWFYSWAGASSIADLKVLPVLVLFATLATLATAPAVSAVSRRFESEADRIALELTGDPDAAVATLRRLAFANLADLRPPRVVVWALFSHPPIAERIGAALAYRAATP